MEQLIITPITSAAAAAAYAEVFALRDEVLRRPLGMWLKNDDLTLDHVDIILTAQLDGKVIACLMLHHIDGQQVQLRQMAVSPEYQGKGAGRVLVQGAEQLAMEKGYSKMILHARKTAVGFYKSMSYEVCSDEYLEVGIPHYNMEKQLAVPASN